LFGASAAWIIPFASIDPHRGAAGVRAARRLITDYGVRGFTFHPNTQAFFPNDRMAYPLYEVIAEHGLVALFHTGQTGVGAGRRAGGGVRLKYSNPPESPGGRRPVQREMCCHDREAPVRVIPGRSTGMGGRVAPLGVVVTAPRPVRDR
jgi:hypothetical protein